MNPPEKLHQKQSERMSDTSFRLMNLTFDLIDRLSPRVKQRALTLGVEAGMTVVDYGCGPGRYSLQFSRLVGASGQVIAVDIHELAIEAVNVMITRHNLKNVRPVVARGYTTGLPGAIADRIIALDMFFGIRQPSEFLFELKRLVKPHGVLVIDDGHQPRLVTRRKILDSGLWKIESDRRDHLECRPV